MRHPEKIKKSSASLCECGHPKPRGWRYCRRHQLLKRHEMARTGYLPPAPFMRLASA